MSYQYFFFQRKNLEEYVKSGRDKDVVDPDENKIFTKRKERLDAIRKQNGSTTQLLSDFHQMVGQPNYN